MCTDDTRYAKLLEKYMPRSAVYRKRVRVKKVRGTYEGIVTGFDDLGRIILTEDNGVSHVFDSGDVTLA